jgi:hypothetical protein
MMFGCDGGETPESRRLPEGREKEWEGEGVIKGEVYIEEELGGGVSLRCTVLVRIYLYFFPYNAKRTW